jgi:hypothetical protein
MRDGTQKDIRAVENLGFGRIDKEHKRLYYYMQIVGGPLYYNVN